MIATKAQALEHLTDTFDMAARHHRDVMEPYVTRLEGLGDDEAMDLMRRALRETFALRFPPRHVAKPLEAERSHG